MVFQTHCSYGFPYGFPEAQKGSLIVGCRFRLPSPDLRDCVTNSVVGSGVVLRGPDAMRFVAVVTKISLKPIGSAWCDGMYARPFGVY